MKLLYDMPIGIGEPHYVQMIKADKLNAWEIYPEIGWNPLTQAKDPARGDAGRGEDRAQRQHGRDLDDRRAQPLHAGAGRESSKGDHVIWHITNVESAKDATHGFALPAYNINLSLEPGEATTIEFDADTGGVFTYYCSEFCSALHLEMVGYFLVEP